MSKSDYVGNQTAWYTNDTEAYKSAVWAGYKDLVSLYDPNMDCLVDQEELLILNFKHLGHNRTNAELDYFNTFKNPDGIHVSEMAKSIFQFRTNDKEFANDTHIEMERILE